MAQTLGLRAGFEGRTLAAILKSVVESKRMKFATIVTAFLCAALLGAPGGAGAAEKTSIPATTTTPQLPAYLARPQNAAPAPGVLILHDCKGLSPHYEKVAEHFASRGYVAVAIDSLSPQKLSSGCTDVAGQARTQAAYARAALDWMRAQPYIDGTRLGLLGYSMGGIAALDIVDSPEASAIPAGLRAVVAYYPVCRDRDPKRVALPIRILDGGDDDWAPAAPCQALADAATAAGKTVTITTYPGATHAFNFDAPDRIEFGHPMRYNAEAAYEAGAETIIFFHRYLSATP